MPIQAPSRGVQTRLFYIGIRFLQLALAVAVVALYARDLATRDKPHRYEKSKWGYAVVVSGLSAVAACGFILTPAWPKIWVVCDSIIFILWTAVLGCFARLYISVDVRPGRGVQRMKNAVLVDLTNMLLWFFSALLGGVTFVRERAAAAETAAADGAAPGADGGNNVRLGPVN